MAKINDIQIVYVKNSDEARAAMEQGYTPIECAFGPKTVVDELQMDHHGPLSHLECVSIRAYRDHFGARATDPRFVVTGTPGADDIFAILALSGLAPHPSRQAPPHLAKSLQRDVTPLVELIAKLDRDPVGVDKTASPWGALLIVWGAMTEGPEGLVRHYGALYEMWRLLEGRPLVSLLKAAEAEDRERRAKAQAAPFEMIGLVKFLADSPVPAPDVYYGRRSNETNPNSPEGWEAPVVVTYVANAKRVSIGAANSAVAEVLFGKGGLNNVFLLLGKGWGGAEAVGGSPHGVEMTPEDARQVAVNIAALIAVSSQA